MTAVSASTVTPASPPNGHSPILEISNAMVRLYKQAFGRGPTKASAHFAGADILVVLLADTMTIAERNLLALGEAQRLREQRLFHEHVLETKCARWSSGYWIGGLSRSSPASTLTMMSRR